MYSRKWINIISFTLAIIIFCAINVIWSQVNFAIAEKEKQDTNELRNNLEISKENNNSKTKEQNESTKESKKETTEKDKETEKTIEKWQIEIPEISLKAQIAEGTSKEILDLYVGHFEITQKTEGNIGLAAHNRGYPVNYFAKLKDLKEGDEIIYTYGDFQKTYIVTKNIKISDIDWSYLQETKENIITLITCIANEPAYRRCVQGIEKTKKKLRGGKIIDKKTKKSNSSIVANSNEHSTIDELCASNKFYEKNNV